ncbi:hypothetical protein BU26DRAFT_17934 [Trematosphaeria pertusa]|uniref:Uncharacterized protein n=1 Tax=Trematosphaeria pertusa TaxID=390896 RepID=A0A6A6J0A0_9PLEO|nr:uncharacterized protein BU26DRAFT_17934 [Trematosphaeria pertusa]KAF2256265.1 hypothetical protein BU26DRAFT_17934 [Trematosphaeria pertusa]
MDSPRSSSRSGRRSYPNLPNLSLAPLSSKYPLDASTPPSPSEDHARTPRTSYIAQKSAPTTPGILSLSQSRSSSRNGRRHNKGYAYEGYFLNPDVPLRDAGEIPKAKSTNTLLPGVSFADETPGRHHRRKGTAPLPVHTPLVRHHTSETTDEWFHRAGLAIAGETRDSKGQGWLVRRESSTSLVNQMDEFEEHPSHDKRHMALLSGEHLADAEYNMFTPRYSRPGSRVNSRVGSRVASARNSRRGSRVGSKIDLMMSAGPKPPSSRHSLETDDSVFEETPVEPDFVEGDGESDGDEEEIARLARERGFGLGGWMDRLIGWTLFSVDEDGEDSSSEDEDEDDAPRPENMTKEELKLRREVEAKRRKLEREAIIAASAVHSHDKKATDTEEDAASSDPKPAPGEEGGGWADAAWLLGVASKVLL